MCLLCISFWTVWTEVSCPHVRFLFLRTIKPSSLGVSFHAMSSCPVTTVVASVGHNPVCKRLFSIKKPKPESEIPDLLYKLLFTEIVY